MNPFRIIWLKATIAFLVPFLLGMASGFGPYALVGAAPPNKYALMIIWCTTLGAGASALSSFLSTSYSEHKAKTESDDAVAGSVGVTTTTAQSTEVVKKQDPEISPLG